MNVSAAASAVVAESIAVGCRVSNPNSKCGGETNEHLDDSIRGSTYCMAGWLHRLSRCRRTDSLAAGFRGHLFDSAFCDGKTDSIGTFEVFFLEEYRQI